MMPANRQNVPDSSSVKPEMPSMISVHLMMQEADVSQDEKIILKNQRVELNSEGHLLLAPLLAQIEEIGDFDFSGRLVKYYSASDNEFIFVGKYPIRGDTFLTKADIETDAPLRISMSLARTAITTSVKKKGH